MMVKQRREGSALMLSSPRARVMMVCICPRKNLTTSGLVAPGCCSSASMAPCGVRSASSVWICHRYGLSASWIDRKRREVVGEIQKGTLRVAELIWLFGRKSAYSKVLSGSHTRSSQTFFFLSSRIGLQKSVVPRRTGDGTQVQHCTRLVETIGRQGKYETVDAPFIFRHETRSISV